MAIRVAVVEDDDRIRTSLKVLLDGSSGFRCVAAYKDAESALKEVLLVKPDVVLMDISLPRMSGIDCVARLKRIIPDILVIMLTVYDDSHKIFNSLKAGAVGYILKSASPSEILLAISDVHAGGSPMSAQIARKVVQSFYDPRAHADDTVRLTDREREILDLLAKGFLYKEIADQLQISRDTVHNHLRHIYEKLHVRSRTEAVVRYLRS